MTANNPKGTLSLKSYRCANPNIGISWDISDFPGQCGAMILYDFDIGGTHEHVKCVAEDFADKIVNYNSWGAAKLVASAVVGSDLHILLNTPAWYKGSIVINPNSDNRIQIFEIDVRR